MKKIISLVIPFALLFLTSCNDDPCKDVVCGVNAVCEEGSCKCVDGWEVDGDGDCTIQDFCFNVDCGTNGTCEQDNSGSWCECDEGYEFDADDKCNQEIRAKYIGTWVGTHQVNGTTSVSYTMTIAADSDVQKAIVTNVMNITCPVSGNPIEAVLSAPRYSKGHPGFTTGRQQ